MKRLLRNKSSNADTHAPAQKADAPPQANESPLYARFSAAHRSHDTPHSKPIVSGPMSLTAKPTTTNQAARAPTADKGSKITRVPSRPEQSIRVINPPSRKSSRNVLPNQAYHDHAHHTTPPLPANPSTTTSLPLLSNDHARTFAPSQTAPVLTRSPSPPVPVRDLGRGHYHTHHTQPTRLNHGPPSPPPLPPTPKIPQTGPPPRSEIRNVSSQSQVTKERPRVVQPVALPQTYVQTYDDDDEYDPFRAVPTITKSQPPPARTQNAQSRLTAASKEPIVQGNSAPLPLLDASSQKKLPRPPESSQLQSSPHPTRTAPTSAKPPLSSPSLVRKKYSPLAAFGLPTPQSASTSASDSQSAASLSQDQLRDAPQPPVDVGGTTTPDQSSTILVKSAPSDTNPLPISSKPSLSSYLEASDVRSGETSSADTRSYNDVPSDQSTHEPRSRVRNPSNKTSVQDSQPRSVRRVAAAPKNRSRHPAESVEHSKAVPAPAPSETPSRFQSSSQLLTDSHDSAPEDNSTSQTSSSLQSDEMPSRISISLPKPSLPLKMKRKSRSQAATTTTTPIVAATPPESPKRESQQQPPAQKMDELPTPASQPRNPHRKGPPIRGRPLIFAAMAANPQAAEIVEDISSEDMFEEVPAHNEYSQQQLQPPVDQTPPPSQPYPSPKSPTTELKPSKSKKGSGGSSGQGQGHVEPEQPRRRRKLSKATKPSFLNESSGSHSHGVEPLQGTAGRHGERPHTPPVNGSNSQAANAGGGILGSPFQLQEAQKSSEKMGHHRRTKSSDHAKLLKRNRDGFKTLTDKQMQKLNKGNSQQQDGHTLVQGFPFPRPMAQAQTHDQDHHHHHEQQLPTPPSHSPDISAHDPTQPTHLQSPPTPPTSEEFVYTRARRQTYPLDRTPSQTSDRLRSDHFDEELEPPPPPPKYYPLAKHIEEPALLANVLCYLSYFEWCTLAVVSREVREIMYTKRELVELVLERYLRTVGYDRWVWRHHDPLLLNLDDLTAYMRGVSIPSHQYARVAEGYLQPNSTVDPTTVRDLAASCRAFTRVVLRLRAQAEAEAEHNARIAATPPPPAHSDSPSPPPLPSKNGSHPPVTKGKGAMSRPSSRAPSPTTSMFSHSNSHAHTVAPSQPSQRVVPVNTFRSPLFRPRRAPLLQVFVPSPEGDWLSDPSVIECEMELKRAGVLKLLRAGDIIWDIAVGDEGNVGRMVWDGSYLLDLDYTWTRAGDLPRYLPALAFPPSYFHRVIRTMGSGNPVVHLDLAPWAEQIAANLQLLTDRMRTETPQGGQHTVVRWVNRSSFTIRPQPGTKCIRIPVPKSAGPGPSPTGAWVIDPGWYGTVVVETEGTNEGLADLQERCKGAFPVRAVGASPYGNGGGNGNAIPGTMREDRRTVFRILREKSRPGEIWLRAVREKERLLP